MRHKHHPAQGYRACLGAIRLPRVYGAERVEAACERALSIGDQTYADAILDRLVHNAHRINLVGESMRRPRQRVS
jgi:transposase